MVDIAPKSKILSFVEESYEVYDCVYEVCGDVIACGTVVMSRMTVYRRLLPKS